MVFFLVLKQNRSLAIEPITFPDDCPTIVVGCGHKNWQFSKIKEVIIIIRNSHNCFINKSQSLESQNKMTLKQAH